METRWYELSCFHGNNDDNVCDFALLPCAPTISVLYKPCCYTVKHESANMFAYGLCKKKKSQRFWIMPLTCCLLCLSLTHSLILSVWISDVEQTRMYMFYDYRLIRVLSSLRYRLVGFCVNISSVLDEIWTMILCWYAGNALVYLFCFFVAYVYVRFMM